MENEVIKDLEQELLLQVLANDIGLKFEVPDILTFIDDDYYLGKIFYNKVYKESRIFPYWRECLQDLFPNNLTTKSSYVTVSGCIGCLTGDTEVKVFIDDSSFVYTMKELFNLNLKGKEIYSLGYSFQEKKIVKDRIIDAFITGLKPTYKITLSDKTTIKCTTNHRFLVQNNQDIEWLSIDTGLTKKHLLFPEYKEIISIEYDGLDVVYDLTTQNTHSFMLRNNVIAHNSGKSTFSSIIMMYDFLKLQSMIDPGQFFELINQNGIWLYGCSIYEYKADQFIKPIKENLNNCPFLQDLKKQGLYNPNIIVSPAYGKNSIVSTDAAAIWLSEVNEYKNPQDVITSALSRMQGRFQKGFGLYNHFILDCSDTTIDSAVETFIHDSPYSKDVVSYRADIWTVKPQMYWHMEPKSFKVYAGDSTIFPHILKVGEDISDYDQSRIIDVPMELYNEFSTDINKALKEKAGIALIAAGLLFPNESIEEHFCLPQQIKEVEVVDEFDNTRIWDLDNVEKAINELPEQRYLYVGIDCGYATDHYGIAIGYVDRIKYREKTQDDPEGTKDFMIKIPIVFGLGRKQQQETSIFKVRDFLYQVNAIRPIKLIAYDNFQSIELTQEMRLIGVETKYFSVEKDKYYLMFKHALNAGMISLPNNQLLYREFRCLKHIGDRVDHSSVESFSNGMQAQGVNSKDLSDAVVRCYAAIRENLEAAIDVPIENNNFHTEYWNSILSNLTQKHTNQKNIYSQHRPVVDKFAIFKSLK